MKKREILLKLKIIQIICAVMVVALFVTVIVSMSGSKTSSKTIDEVTAAVTPLFSGEASPDGADRNLKKYYGLNAADYDGVTLYFPNSNVDADELLIIKVSDTDQIEDITDILNERVETQKNTFNGYAPEQYDLYCNAIIDVQGNYILFVVNANADAIDEAFRKAL